MAISRTIGQKEKQMSLAVGIVMLPTSMYCLVEALTDYDAFINGTRIKIHFPRYEKPEKRILGDELLKAPDVAKHLRRGNEEIEWGIVNKQTLETTGCTIHTIAVECSEEDVQAIYDVFNPWLLRFQTYCFLCNRQYYNATESISTGGNHLEMIGEKGYIKPDNPPEVCITLQMIPEEAFLRKTHIDRAMEFASSNMQIRPEYEFMLKAYEAEEKHQHRLSIIDACSALEMCLMRQIDDHLAVLLPEKTPLGKRRYLEQLIEYMGKLDPEFKTMEPDLKTDVTNIRNDILHQNRNPHPTRAIACKAIDMVDKALRYFYSDFVE